MEQLVKTFFGKKLEDFEVIGLSEFKDRCWNCTKIKKLTPLLNGKHKFQDKYDYYEATHKTVGWFGYLIGKAYYAVDKNK